MGKARFNPGWSLRREGRRRRCFGCRKPIVHGDRCPDCARELRQRHNRKPR